MSTAVTTVGEKLGCNLYETEKKKTDVKITEIMTVFISLHAKKQRPDSRRTTELCMEL